MNIIMSCFMLYIFNCYVLFGTYINKVLLFYRRSVAFPLCNGKHLLMFVNRRYVSENVNNKRTMLTLPVRDDPLSMLMTSILLEFFVRREGSAQ